MARSEEQKKDLKFKIWVAITLAIVLAPFIALGPALGKIANGYIQEPMNPNSPQRLLWCAQIQASTLRKDDAKKTLNKWFELFAKEEGRDWDDVMNGTGEFTTRKYDLGDGISDEVFLPWIFPDGKPAPVQEASDELVGTAINLYAMMHEDEKDYEKSAHLFLILSNVWPKNSEQQLLGADGMKRMAIRSF